MKKVFNLTFVICCFFAANAFAQGECSGNAGLDFLKDKPSCNTQAEQSKCSGAAETATCNSKQQQCSGNASTACTPAPEFAQSGNADRIAKQSTTANSAPATVAVPANTPVETQGAFPVTGLIICGLLAAAFYGFSRKWRSMTAKA